MRIIAQILHYNSIDSAKKVCNAVANQTLKIDAIVFIDNGSSDDDKIEILNLKVDDVLYLENLGVGAGHNAGFKYIQKKYKPNYIWVLEHDAIPEQNCLENLVSAIKSNELVAYYPAEHSRLSFEKYKYWQFLSFGFYQITNKINTPNYIGGLSFNGLLLPVTIIEKIGYLNEMLFISGEDIDYRLRINRAGGYVLRVNSAVVNHDLYKDYRHLRFGKNVLLLSNSSIMRDYYSYRNNIFSQLQKNGVTFKIIFIHFRGLMLNFLFRSHPFKRFKIRNKAFFDAVKGKMGKSNYFFLLSIFLCFLH